MEHYLKPTAFLNFNTEAVQSLIAPFKNLPEKERTIGMYLKIRDAISYNAEKIYLTPHYYKASTLANYTKGHCVDKAILLTACLRGLNIPARLRFAKIKNHIGLDKIIEAIGTEELAPHGIVDVFINEKWLKISPAFDKETCKKYNVSPLEFDGENNSMFQEYNKQGAVFMEYLEDYGHFDDVPVDFIVNTLRTSYPKIFPTSNIQKN